MHTLSVGNISSAIGEKNVKLVITGGGTGGHVFGGIAIAQEFLSQSKSNETLFIGSSEGMEVRLVPKAGYKLETLKLGKLVGQSWFKRLSTLIQIPVAILKCYRILKRFNPDMVVGVGGYAAGPCIVAAKFLGIPIGVLEQNSVVGFTNRISAKLANQVFLAFDDIPSGIEASKCVVTGNPARSAMKPCAEKKSSPFNVFAFGGSQGATGINKLLTEAASHLKDLQQSLKFIHQTGERDLAWVQKTYADLQFPAEAYAFIDDMQSRYNDASVVICRAGSGTISELGATQNAAIFIPFPLAAGNHQEINARLVERAGAAKVLIQGQTDAATLANLIRELHNDSSKLSKMRQSMGQFHKPDAAKRIVEIMKAHALKRSP